MPLKLNVRPHYVQFSRSTILRRQNEPKSCGTSIDPATSFIGRRSFAAPWKIPGKAKGGLGLPIARTVAFREFEARHLTVNVLLSSEWAEQIKQRLHSADEELSIGAFAAVEEQARLLGDHMLEALIFAIEVGQFNSTVAIDVSGYENP